MRFGRTLRQSIYEPWKDKYMDYAKLKGLLREDRADDEDVPWTEDDETRFCEEIFNVQLEKVAKFQDGEFASLKERVETAFSKLKDLAPADGKPVSDITVARLKELESSLDGITDEVRELKKYSQINYTGFQKIAKKHDRRRGDAYKILPLTRITLSKEEFNSERAYAPLLNKLSTMYFVIRQHVEADGTDKRAPPSGLESSAETHNGERYTAHKCEWSVVLTVKYEANPSQSGSTSTTSSRCRRSSCASCRRSSTASNRRKSWTPARTRPSRRCTLTTPSSRSTPKRWRTRWTRRRCGCDGSVSSRRGPSCTWSRR